MIEKVKEILLEHTEVPIDKIGLDTDLIKDLGLNSLDVVNLIVTFEDEFGIEIPDRAIQDFVTVGNLVDYLQKEGLGYVY